MAVEKMLALALGFAASELPRFGRCVPFSLAFGYEEAAAFRSTTHVIRQVL
jgi:hypothetical protein